MCARCDTLRERVRKLFEEALANDEELKKDRRHSVAAIVAEALQILCEEIGDPLQAEAAARALFGNAVTRFLRKKMESPEYKEAAAKMQQELEEALAEKVLRDMPEAKMVH